MHRYLPISVPDDFEIGSCGSITATISSSLVDSTLTNFPVGIEIGDVSFMAARSATDWQNLHCTVGGTECYVEVDVWDVTTPQAILHVKVASVSSSADTVIEIRFGADNTTTYVGETGDTAAQNVWDSNFVVVYHMSQDPTGGSGCMLDSTSNGNNGTPGGSMTSGDLVDSGFGKALDFDGTDDHIDIPDMASTIVNSSLLEYYLKVDYTDVSAHLISGSSPVGGDRILWSDSSNNISFYMQSSNTALDGFEPTKTAFDHVSFNWTTSSNIDGYFNGAKIGDLVPPESSFTDLYNIGGRDFTSIHVFFKGQISEFRISNIARSAAWIKATNAVLQKTLVTLS